LTTTYQPTNIEQATDPTTRGDCASPILLIGLFIWIGVLAGARTLTSIGLSISPVPRNEMLGALLTAGQAVLSGIGLLPAAIWWRRRPYNAIFRMWALADLLVLIFAPVQLLGYHAGQSKALIQIIITLLFTLILWRRMGDRPNSASSTGRGNLPLAFLLGGLAFIPFAYLGALGSPLDTLLALIQGLSLGLVIGVLLEGYTLRHLRDSQLQSAPTLGQFFMGLLAAMGMLVLVASGTAFSFGSMQLMLMLVLPALGAILVVMNLRSGRISPIVWLAGLAFAAPIIFFDANELAVIISVTTTIGDVLQNALRAAGMVTMGAYAASLLAFIIFLATRNRNTEDSTAPPSGIPMILSVLAVAAWIGVGITYFAFGQPGFYGDQLFVVMKSQADLSSASQIQDVNARRDFVYQTLVKHANQDQQNLRQALTRLHIGYTPYYLEDSMEVNADPFMALWLRTMPGVDRVLYSPHLRPLPSLPSPIIGSSHSAPTSPDWNLTMIGADRVWNDLGVTGQGIVVGQSDSGVDGHHPDLAPSYRGQGNQNNYNWYDPWFNTTSPSDYGGHGTHTLGIILGKTTGVAPGATWIGCVNLGRNLGNPALYLNCMQFMLAPFPQHSDPLKDGDPARGAMVLNNSWGCPDLEGCDAQALQYASQALRQAGIFVEASAGNDGPACSTIRDPLSLYASVFTTGAINSSGNLASFSSLGPVTADGSDRVKPDILAPGVNVLSTLPDDSYGRLDGTSMAGPHTVGVVALMWSANPKLIGDIDRTDQILEKSATAYNGIYPNCPGAHDMPSTDSGYGILNAYQAVKLAIAAK
jgi:subtilisin family serine protease